MMASMMAPSSNLYNLLFARIGCGVSGHSKCCPVTRPKVVSFVTALSCRLSLSRCIFCSEKFNLLEAQRRIQPTMAKRPNFLLIVADDLGFSDVGRLRLPIWIALPRTASGSRISMQRLNARPRGRCYLAARTIASCQRIILQYTGIWIAPLSANSIFQTSLA